jgi:enterochelin esterase-like enzyme
MPIFENMQPVKVSGILTETRTIESKYLEREITVDFYLPEDMKSLSTLDLLLINDGQNMEEVGLISILKDLYNENLIRPLFCAAIHSGKERKMEYGIASEADYQGRGLNAGLYTAFIIYELLPFIKTGYQPPSFASKGFAGFSLGGLSAMDIAWNHPQEFSRVGVFSGSFWWRSIDQTNEEYNDDQHRIMQNQIRRGHYRQELKFFFQCGNMDEVMDRNNNGIIDSIDDTLDVIKELIGKGYTQPRDIQYLEMPDGKHDMATWARAMPVFLKWGWGTVDV